MWKHGVAGEPHPAQLLTGFHTLPIFDDHTSLQHMAILRLPEQEYGFIQTSDGREIIFHRNSVLGAGFNALEIGSDVRFSEEEGDKGPQASTVHA